MGNVSTSNAVTVTPSPVGTPGAGSPSSSAPSAPAQGGVEMATAMAAKLNAMLMAKGKLKPLQPLPSKVLIPPHTQTGSGVSGVGCWTSHRLIDQGWV